MRVTFSAQNRNSSAGLEDAASRLLEFQRQVSTGKRIEKPSDDPSATLGSIGEHAEIAVIDQYTRATDTIASRLAVVDTVLRANEAARAIAGPGIPMGAVDKAARDVITAAGYGDYFIHRTGHGIGIETHEEPYIVAGNDEPLEPGHAFSVEPGIYLPGRHGARIEDIVVCAENGGERLNHTPRDLVVV